MRKSQFLATASVIALSTAAALPMSAVITKQARADITIDWSFSKAVDLKVDAGTASVAMASEQENASKGSIAALVDNTFLAIPIAGVMDYTAGVDTVDVIANDATSTAIGNLGVKTVDIFTVSGPGTTGGGVTGAAQINRGATSITSKVDATNMRIASEDLGAGSSQILDGNLIEASTSGNIADSTLSGNVNVLLTSTEDGKAAVSQGTNKFLTASGTLMVGNMQINDNLSAFSAGVTTSRIGSIAYTNDDTTAIEGIPLSIQDNTINAEIEGNNADNLLSVTDGKDLTLEGAIGVINAQLNETDAMVIKASVISSDIEAGDTTTILDPIDNLDGSKVDFSGNAITASALASTGTNTLKVDGVTIDGSFVASKAQDHTINTNTGNTEGHTRALADVYIASLQFNEATVTSTIGGAAGDAEDGDLNVLVEDVTGSSVLAGDSDLADAVFDGNSILTSARGNVITNAIDIGDVTTYSALTGLGSTQNTDGGNKQIASTNGDVLVSVATLDESTGSIVKSSVTADGNVIGSQSITNTGSNSISIDSTTITGPGIDPDETNEGFMTRAWHSNLVASASTDIALVSNQQTENSPVTSAVIGSFVVDAADVGGAAGSEVTDSSVSLSGNSSSALTVGNAVGENVIEVDTTVTFAASVGLVSFQVVQDNAGAGVIDMSAVVAPSDDAIDIAIIDLTSSALSTTNSQFDVDQNSISAAVYGNLVAGSTNAIRIDGVTVGDNNMGARTKGNTTADVSIGAVEAVVDRNIESDDLPQTTVNSGFSLISDQSFEDSGLNPVIASITSDDEDDLIDVNIGSSDPAAEVSSVDVSASDNDITSRVNLNTSNNAIEIGQNSKVETLDANITLVNTQTFWDEFGVPDGSGRIVVGIEGDIDVDVDAGATTITDVNVEANGNDILGEARISKAANSIAVSTQTQVVTGLIAGADVQSVNIGADKSTVRSEIGLVNDQDFNGLMLGPTFQESGVAVELDGTDIFVDVNTEDGSLEDSVVEADGNSFRAWSLGNDAVNALSLNFGTVNLEDALIGGAAGNAPLAIISNAQRGSDGDQSDAGFFAGIDDADIEVDLNDVDNGIDSVEATVDGNTYNALARVNNGVNVLDVSGTKYEEVSSTTPLVQALNIPVTGGAVAAEDLAFGIASYQLNSYDVGAIGEDSQFLVDVDNTLDITSSKLSVSSNQLSIEARSNDNINDASVKFTNNNVSAFAANVQSAGPGGIFVGAFGEDIEFQVDGADATGIDTSVDVDGNRATVTATANRALLNTLSLDGTNLYSGTGTTTPSALVDPAGAGADVSVVSDASVLNVQGPATVVSTSDEVVFVYGEDIDFFVDFDVFESGSISIDNNVASNLGIIHSANNLLGMGASYGYNEATGAVSLTATKNVNTVEATGSIISQQIVTDDSGVFVQGEDTDLNIDVNDISDIDAVSLSVSKNDVLDQATAGTVLNRMDVLAGTSITGVVGTPTPEIGDLSAGNPLVANADFNILNHQAGETEVFAFGEDTELSITVGSDAVNDSLTVSGNELDARATGFNASNIIVLNAGSSSDATANVLNRQNIGNATVEALQDEDPGDGGIALFINLGGSGADTSSLELDDNDVRSTASGNVALNAISTTAGATLQESSGAGITIDPAGPVFVAPTDSDYSVLNYQSFTDSQALSTTNEVGIFIDGLSGATGVDNSSLSVSDNTVAAASTANRAENYLVLNTGTFQHPSATVGNLQTTSGATISAAATNVTIGIGNGDNVNAASNNSSFTVRGNQIGATAIGNSAIGSITGGN